MNLNNLYRKFTRKSTFNVRVYLYKRDRFVITK